MSALVGADVGTNSNETVEMSILVRMRVEMSRDGSVDSEGWSEGARERGIVNFTSVDVATRLYERFSMLMVGWRVDVALSGEGRCQFEGILVSCEEGFRWVVIAVRTGDISVVVDCELAVVLETDGVSSVAR